MVAHLSGPHSVSPKIGVVRRARVFRSAGWSHDILRSDWQHSSLQGLSRIADSGRPAKVYPYLDERVFRAMTYGRFSDRPDP